MKALVRIDNQIINVTVPTGSPVSFINWATAKQILQSSQKATFVQAENLSLPAEFVDYKKTPIVTIGTLNADIRSEGWELRNTAFLITERPTRCILGVDLQRKMGISTKQKSAPREINRQGRSINHVVHTVLNTHCVPSKKRARKSRYISKIKLEKHWKIFWQGFISIISISEQMIVFLPLSS